MHMLNSTTYNQSWDVDAAGYLRCNACIIKTGVMEYDSAVLSGVPEHLMSKDRISLYVPVEALTNNLSLRSLEGKNVVLGHQTQTVDNDENAIGNVCGTPKFNSGYLYADLLIKDSKAINKLMADGLGKRITEISSGYGMQVDWTPGTTPDGYEYDGVQRNLDYNHVAVVAPGNKGRGGPEVRIYNEAGEDKMANTPDYVSIKLPTGDRIRVHNEDELKLEKSINESEDKVDPSKMTDMVARATELQGALEAKDTDHASEREKLEGELSELRGQLSTLKEELERVLSADSQGEQAIQVATENAEAKEVMKATGADSDDKMRVGNSLRTYVVNSIREHLNQTALTSEQLKDESYVKGVYSTYVENSKRKATVKKMAIVNSSGPTLEKKGYTSLSPAERLKIALKPYTAKKIGGS